MTDSNRTRITYIPQATIGTTPAVTNAGNIASNYRTARITGESLAFKIDNIQSQELRADRKISDLIQVGARNNGDINFELSFPSQRSFLDDMFQGSMFADWVNTYERFNEASANPISGITLTTTITVNSTTGVLANSIVQLSGFTNAANNAVFNVSSVTGTTIVTTGLTNETPPVGARVKVVGFQGATGDITATATGLAATTANFVNMGLAVGMWIKVGGQAVGSQFNTTLLNTFCRITAVSATTLTLDNRPAGWTTDAGTGKNIRLFWGDYLRDGTTKKFYTFEKGYLAQGTPSYLVYKDMHLGQMSLSLSAGAIITGSFNYLGTTHTASTTVINATGPAPATTSEVINAVSNVARLAENGSGVGDPNFIREFTLTLNNNLREQTGIGTLGLVGIGVGQANITGMIKTYFGDLTLYNKYVAGTATSLNVRMEKTSQAIVITLPKIEFTDGGAPAQGINQDVMVDLPFQALLDTVTNCQMQMDRLAYYE